MADLYDYLGIADFVALKALTTTSSPRLKHRRPYLVHDTSAASDGSGLPGYYFYKAEPLPGEGALPGESLPDVVAHPTTGVFVLIGSAGGSGGGVVIFGASDPNVGGVTWQANALYYDPIATRWFAAGEVSGWLPIGNKAFTGYEPEPAAYYDGDTWLDGFSAVHVYYGGSWYSSGANNPGVYGGGGGGF